MGLFNRKKKLSDIDLWKCNVLQSLSIDIDSELSTEHSKLSVVAETAQYTFFLYRQILSGHILRREKANPSKIVYFGQGYSYAVPYKDFLFICDKNGEVNQFFIWARNLRTGELIKCDWLGKGEIIHRTIDVVYAYVQDTINGIKVEGEKLIFDITRQKSNTPFKEAVADKYDIDTTYRLEVTYENNQFRAVRVFPSPSTNTVQSSNNKATLTPSTASTINISAIKTPSAAPQSVPSSNPNSGKRIPTSPANLYSLCDICKKTSNKYSPLCYNCSYQYFHIPSVSFIKSRDELKKSIATLENATVDVPDSAQLWYSLGEMYEADQQNSLALAAYDKAIDLLPEFFNALLHKAYVLANLSRYRESYELTKYLCDTYTGKEQEQFLASLPQSVFNIREPLASDRPAVSSPAAPITLASKRSPRNPY